MRRFILGANWPRVLLGLGVPTALVLAGGGSALAVSAPAAAPAAVACTVHWVGKDFPPMWTDPRNWSTGKLPGPADDVCITNTGDDVLTSVSISVHSLLLGSLAGIALNGTSSRPLTATVATGITMTPGGISRIDLTHASISAAKINDQGGFIYTDFNCNLTSPDIVFGAGGSLQAANGTTTLTGLPQLSNGTLIGATIHTDMATVVVPGDITHLVAANVTVGTGSEIRDAAGHNALTGLTSVDAQSSLLLASNLTLPGGMSASGNVTLAGANLALGAPFTQAQGELSVQQGATLSASQVTIGNGATLFDVYGGGGTIAGNLVNDGSVETGATTGVSGNYTQAPGASLRSGFGGLLAVSGQATLAGSVSASQFVPQPGDTSPVITFGSLSGNFTGHSLGIVLVTKPHEIDAVITPQIAASPTTVAPGSTATVTGGGFHYAETAQIFLDQASGRALGTATADIRGNFAVTVTIPASAKVGMHRLIAAGSDGDQASTTITVS